MQKERVLKGSLFGLGNLAVAVIAVVLIYCLLGGKSADLVLYGKVYTGKDGETTTEAIAKKGDQIVYVGSKDGAQNYIDGQTRIFDYESKTIMPGITDGHTHINMATEAAKYQADISNGNSLEDYVEIIKEYIATHPDQEMYLGAGWNHDFFGANGPTKDILDAISIDKPIYIKSLDAHSGWMNSKMLELIGVDKNTPDPTGGKIERDSNGNPSGCLRETALGTYVKPHIKVHSVDEYKEMILESQKEYAGFGYTAYTEIFIDTDDMNENLFKAYEELDQAGQLLLRVHAAWVVNNNDGAKDELQKIIEHSKAAKGGKFELTDVKYFMDGVAETGTALLSEPYANDPSNYGLDRWAGEEGFKRLVECVALTNQNGLVAHFHAIGDAAVTKALDAIEAARKQPNVPDIRNAMTHLELIKPSDLPRFKELNVVAVANLTWGVKIPDTFKAVEVVQLGEKRANQAYPYKLLANAGAVLSFATDYPPGAFESPMFGFQVSVTRSVWNIDETVRDKTEAFSKDETLRIMTYGGAYQMNQEQIRGTLEVGKKADLVVLDMDLFDVSIEEASVASSVLTLVDGKVVYPAIELN